MTYLIDPRNTTKPYNFELLWALKNIGIKYKFIGNMPKRIENPPVRSCNYFLPFSRGLFGERPKVARAISNISQTPEIIAGWMNLIKMLKREDIVHILWVTSPSVESIIIPKLHTKIRKLVHTAHNLLPHRARKKDYELFKKIYPSFDNIILHSSYTGRELVQTFPDVDEKKISVIPVGNYENFYKVHDKTTEPDKIKFNTRTFLFMGPIKPYKGFDILHAAARALTHKNFKILVKSKWTPDDNFFIKYSTSLSYQQLGILYRSADVVVLPYTNISLATPLLEAAYFAKPVIVSKIGVLQEIVRDGKEGFVVEVGSVKQLTEAMEKMVDIPEKRLKEMGQSLKVRSVEEFPWSRIAEQIASIYESY